MRSSRASLHELVALMTARSVDVALVRAVTTLLWSICRPAELVRALVLQWDNVADAEALDTSPTLLLLCARRLRIVCVLSQWADSGALRVDCCDDPDAAVALLRFVQSARIARRTEGSSLDASVRRIAAAAAAAGGPRSATQSDSRAELCRARRMNSSRLSMSAEAALSLVQSATPKAIAEQLTLLEFWHYYAGVSARELAQRCVGGASLRDGKPRALPKEDAAAAAAEAAASALPIVAEMVDVFNRRARGIKLLVLARCAKARDGAKTRAKRAARWIAVASELRQLRNFNTLFAAVAALTGPFVKRYALPPGSRHASAATTSALAELAEGVDARGGYAKYRAALRTATGGHPCIPALPVVLKDMSTIDCAHAARGVRVRGGGSASEAGPGADAARHGGARGEAAADEDHARIDVAKLLRLSRCAHDFTRGRTREYASITPDVHLQAALRITLEDHGKSSADVMALARECDGAG